MNRPRALGAASATVLLLAILALSWWGTLDEVASVRTHAALQRALVTFALTRTLNGAISVAQGTELAFEPAGVGVVVSAGEILDPLNDLVEQFSWLALLAATSLGIQIMLGEMFATLPVNVVLSVAIVLSIVALWWPSERGSTVRAALLRLTATFIFLRFAVVLATIGTGFVNEYFLTPARRSIGRLLVADARAARIVERYESRRRPRRRIRCSNDSTPSSTINGARSTSKVV